MLLQFQFHYMRAIKDVKQIHKKLSGVVQQAMLIAFCVYLIRPDGTKANHCPETIKLYACEMK